MDRRSFLRAAGLSVAATSLPGWLQACSSRREAGVEGHGGLQMETPGEEAEASSLPTTPTRLAFERARAAGRPLLVFVVPHAKAQQYQRGAVLGVYLNRIGIDRLADLALCDIWCAQPAEIRDQLACGPAVDDSVIAVLVETDGGGCALVAPDLPPIPAGKLGDRNDADVVAAWKLRNDLLYERLHAVIAPDLATLRDRSEAACAKAFPATGRVPKHRQMSDAQLVQAVPAWVRLQAETADPASRAAWKQSIEFEALHRYRSSPPPRTKWATSHGCGVLIEGEGGRMACGMGYTPDYSSRFLIFYTEGNG